jgi:hypothetical protein
MNKERKKEGKDMLHQVASLENNYLSLADSH